MILTQTPFITACRSFLPGKKKEKKLQEIFQTEANSQKCSAQQSRKGFPALPLLPSWGYLLRGQHRARPQTDTMPVPKFCDSQDQELGVECCHVKSLLKYSFLIHFSELNLVLMYEEPTALTDSRATSKGYFCSKRIFFCSNGGVFFPKFLSNNKNEGSRREELPQRSAPSQLLQDTKQGGMRLHPHCSRV